MEVPLIKVDQLFENVNYLTSQFVVSSNIYKDFLRFAGRFINNQGDGKGYTIANQMLIFGFNSGARLCYDEATWNSMGISVIKPEEPIHVMQKSNAEKGYKDRIVYDISSTNAAPLQDVAGPDPGTMCEILMKATPCKIEFTKVSASGMANYNHDTNKISVGKGFTGFEHIFMEMCRVYGHYYIAKDDEARHKQIYDKRAAELPKEVVLKDAYYKYVEGKYYEITDTDKIKSEADGKLFLVERDPGGSLYKVPVIKQQEKVKADEVKVPQFVYRKGMYKEDVTGISYMVSSAVGINTDIYKDFQNLNWREFKPEEVRRSLDRIVNISRLIKHNYDEKLNELIKAQSASAGYESEVM